MTWLALALAWLAVIAFLVRWIHSSSNQGRY